MFNRTPEEKLLLKLRGALTYTLRTCVFGTSNKIDDIVNSNRWVLFQRWRYHQMGYYRKSSQYPLTKEDKQINKQFNGESFFKPKKEEAAPIGNKKKWYYHTEHSEEILSHEKHFFYNNRLNLEESSLMDNDWAPYFFNTLLTLEKRQGNCGDRSHLFAKKLWENSEGIDRIECVETATFDHQMIIVNRKLGSNLHDSDTWGPGCWVIDSWYGDEGLIFPGLEFKNKIKIIKDFGIRQDEALSKIGILSDDPVDNNEETLKECVYEIIPSKDRYPYSHLTPFQPIEYYYSIDNAYTEDLLDAVDTSNVLEQSCEDHKKKYAACLDDVRSKNRMR